MYTLHGKVFMGGCTCEHHAGRHCIIFGVGLLWEVAVVSAMGGRRGALPPTPFPFFSKNAFIHSLHRFISYLEILIDNVHSSR